MNLFYGNKIHRRFTFTLVGAIVFIMLIVSTAAILRNVNTIDTQLERRLADASKLAEKSLSSAIWHFNDEYVDDFVESLFLYEDIVFVKVLTGNKVIKEKTRPDIHQRDFTFLKPSNYKIKKTAIRHEGKTIGEIQIAATRERIRKTIINNSALTIILMVMIISAILLITFFISRKHIFKPLLKLENSATKIAGGDLDAFIDTSGTDEIGHLAKTFDQMIKNIKTITASREREVGDRKQVAEALRESESQVRLLLDSTAEAIYRLDMQGNCIFANSACLQFLGYETTDDLIGKNMHQLIHHTRPDDSPYPEEECLIYKAFKKGTGTHVDDEVLWRADGTSFWAEYWSYPVYRDNQITGSVVTFLNIDDRKKAEEDLRLAHEKLVRQEKLAVLGQLSGGVGHELRNPLGVISNAVYYLKMVQPEADEKIKEYLETISVEVRRSTKIVADLLDLSRTKHADREPVAVSDLIKQVLDKCRPPENVKVATQFASDLPSLYVDPHQIDQVFSNLITNAYQAMPDGGELTIEARAEENKAHVSVTDTGYGISKENLEKVFEPLFTTKARGIGLGLVVSKRLVEANGGTIEVKSEKDKGSTFTLILPFREATT